jgi:SulP family sulfate permease
MGYALLAGLPPIHGLYASVAPLLLYAVLGTSRHLAVGPVAMDSILVAGSVGAIATIGTENYILVAAALGVMVGVVQAGLGFLRAGFLVNFLSRPVVAGFTAAAALIIAAPPRGPASLGICLGSSFLAPITYIASFGRRSGALRIGPGPRSGSESPRLLRWFSSRSDGRVFRPPCSW